LSDREQVIMRGDIEGIMKASEDSVMVIDLGQARVVKRERLRAAPRGPCWSADDLTGCPAA
ncbi:MAG: hypothetical protein ACHQ2F_13200, partial [Desulfobaccales bacterium]